jgi:hypothetical protein
VEEVTPELRHKVLQESLGDWRALYQQTLDKMNAELGRALDERVEEMGGNLEKGGGVGVRSGPPPTPEERAIMVPSQPVPAPVPPVPEYVFTALLQKGYAEEDFTHGGLLFGVELEALRALMVSEAS